MTWIRSAFTSGAVLVLLVFTALLTNQSVAGQMVINSDMQFDYAMKLYQDQDYDTAQTEFKRFVHFFPDDPRVGEAMFKTGMALFHQNRFFDAARQFNRIIEDRKIQDPFTRESYFMQSRAFVKLGNLGYGQLVLQNFLKLTEDIALQDRIYLELAQIHIQASRSPGIDELDQAQTSLEKISPASARNFKVDEQTAMIRKVRAAPEKNPTLAGLFALIPGGGFLYCERFKDAAVAFALNAGLLLGAYTAFDNGNPALGGVVSFMEAGFYSAGIYGSISAAHKHNHAVKVQILGREFNAGSTITAGTASFSLSLPF
ncbi:tetratricopeptide repeat protein [Desulfotignum phosphitoxidans]|uniref:Tetratricopeptide repeat protein n=1 Tax=Desulfotignum phosphitoxidans DSM 13687 TaxID=1286635 RepID=S0G4D5_9BACT|nr:tetratricopeptide repeat protein [Desulfotignum phosphitoxidans]EMS80454.1 tetratricopeptide repeat protein [Desulfotignum phosphitoxidans DSM 13687]